MKTAPPDAPSLYNSRIILTFVNLLKARYAHIDIDQLLTWADMKHHQVADQWHWFSQEQVNRFYDRLVAMTGNRNIAREAGRYAASADSIGVVQHYVLGFLNPSRLYEHIGKTASKFTRSTRYECRKLGKHRVEITVTPYEGIRERDFQCLNRIGFLEAVVMIFCDSLPRIEHPECIFRGDPCCRYIISWRQIRFNLLRKLRNLSAALGLAALPVLFFLHSGDFLQAFLSLYLPAFLVLWLFYAQGEKAELRRNLEELRISSDSFIDQIEHNYDNALLINTIAQSIAKETSVKDIIRVLIDSFRKHLDFDQVMIFLGDSQKTLLSFEGGHGYAPTLKKVLKKTAFPLGGTVPVNIFVSSFTEQKPLLVSDIEGAEDELPPGSLEFARSMGFKSFLSCPISCTREALGILVVANGAEKRPLLNRDLTLLCGVAPVIGISLRNAELLQNRERQFNATLQALAATIDARDPLTAGHSERVTRFSLGICRQLNLSEEECEAIRAAALLHDYGKIAVPDAILKKPGRLSAYEYELVKRHATQTRQALEKIPFEGIYRDVPAIAGAHHERIDGSGYPQGLTGPQIPLGAKIIAVADFFEAITSKRHYRDPMPRCVAIRELRKKRGLYFEPAIVDAFLKYYEGEQADDPSGQTVFATQLCRESIRVQCRIPLTILHRDIHTQATITDISTRGLFAATSLAAREGSPVRLFFSLPGADAPAMELDGRVIWTNHSCLPRKVLFPAGLGIAFADLEESRLETLMQFVCRRLETSERTSMPAMMWHS